MHNCVLGACHGITQGPWVPDIQGTTVAGAFCRGVLYRGYVLADACVYRHAGSCFMSCFTPPGLKPAQTVMFEH
jgi:hypothetical protein